jgi:hypothetical protein
MKPHRGTMILILGILGIVLCFICGIFAFIMGGKDLQEMQNGTMDPSGMGITKAGRICGIIGAILGILVIGINILLFIIGMGAAAAGAGSP